MSSNFYRAFEDRYRGSRELIKERLRAYAPFTTLLAALYPGAQALDLGCGRGEWLELSIEQGFSARGVDLDEGMLAACRERGLQVQTIDALSALRELPDSSVALVSAFHLVEHLSFDDGQQLIAETLRVLVPGGLLIMETPNPENLVVGTSNFYLDPSHIKPVPPLLLDFMVGHAGFGRQKVVRLQGGDTAHDETALGLLNVLQDVSFDYGIVAQKQGDASMLAAFDAVFDAEYGTALFDIAARYDYQATQQRQETKAGIDGLRAALERAEGERAQTLAGLGGTIQAFSEHTNQRLEAAEASNSELRKVSFPVLEQRIGELTDMVERNRIHFEERLDAFNHGDIHQQLHQARLHLMQLEYQIQAIHGSTSWRITAPGRRLGGLARRAVSAAREGRIRSGVQRRLSLLSSQPGAAGDPRGWRTRLKNSTAARRIVMPLLRRFPALKPLLLRLVGAATPPVSVSSKPLGDWPGPLPEEYLHMPQSSRKVLLDLARAAQEQTHS